ncbi:putative short-chain dehydrogenase [Aaosphaeria arxii CBS 175.79]|uniref:Putative short-chain dehydrogenase n=1 Tax=Aaosphaeria arxii CBS 175.79 TaxID=1450172 RepID=A0A6A5XVR6_9PLEO|nr:putative short-chain dehydrogenase [Aaosphaeria arxii CBS 175.79]KAF2017036.1 putative short-chain dehydrogenase [Aaosphaeria arxii CBS 175.79]
MGFLYSQFFKTPPYPKGDLTGKTVVVTGSNVGLGKEAARHVARLGASRLILAVRSLDKGHAAKQDISQSTGLKNIEVWKLDMANYKSIQAFAKQCEAELDRLDIFIANAGVVRAEWHEAEGQEEGMTVNVTGSFLLLGLILPKMKETAAKYNTRPVFTTTGSAAYDHTTFPQRAAADGEILAKCSDRAFAEKHWDQQYPVSKLVQLWGIRQIGEHHPASEFPVTINVTNPGLCHSELSRDMNSWGFWLFKLIVARSTEVGSRTLLAGALAGPESHGEYLSDGYVEEPTELVTGKAGREAQARVATEIIRQIDSIVPGVSKNFRN